MTPEPFNPTYVAWDVYLHGQKIDTVFVSPKDDKKEVYDSLVNHDGYDPEIVVCRA